MRSWTKFFPGLIVAGLLSIPACGNTNPPQPGMANYIEGRASIDSQPLKSNSAGSTELQAGQTLTTEKGKIEILLTPGVFLRVADNSSVRMDSPGLARTAMTLERGHAILEVADIHKENVIAVNEDGRTLVWSKGAFMISTRMQA
jgi:hypothetical protein